MRCTDGLFLFRPGDFGVIRIVLLHSAKQEQPAQSNTRCEWKTVPFSSTSISFLEVHKAELRETERVIAKANDVDEAVSLSLVHFDLANPSILNFQTVAAEATFSTAWLYRQEELRVRIVRSRRTTNYGVIASASDSQDRERRSRQNIVATLRLRIKTLEEKNRELTELLERAYGVIAQT